MILLLLYNLSKNLSEREFTHCIGLANPLPIIQDGLLSFSRSNRSISSALLEILTSFGVLVGVPLR